MVSYIATGPQKQSAWVSYVVFEEEKQFFSKKEFEQNVKDDGEIDPVIISVTRLTKEEYEAYTAE